MDSENKELGPLVGTRYSLLEKIGEGGMGSVYLAENILTQQKVVLKLLKGTLSGSREFIDRMRIEGEALSVLDHPNVVKSWGHGITALGRPYLLMERLEGETLAQEFRRMGCPPVLTAIEDALQLLAGVGAAHALGIVHRDVKLSNVYVCRKAGRRTIKLLDFGIAKILERRTPATPAPLAVPTDRHIFIGSATTTSPEQALGWPVDERSDLYSIAVLLYTLLAGQGPFDHRRERGELIAAHISDFPAPLSRYAPCAVPKALAQAVSKALAKDPASRFQSANEFSESLLSISQSLSSPQGSLPIIRFARSEIGLEKVATSPSETPEAVAEGQSNRCASPRTPFSDSTVGRW